MRFDVSWIVSRIVFMPAMVRRTASPPLWATSTECRATSADLSRGMLLLAVYSAGLAVPFLLAAVAVERFLVWFQRFRKYLPWVMRVSGALLVVVGVLLLTGEFTRMAGWLQTLTPDFLRGRL